MTTQSPDATPRRGDKLKWARMLNKRPLAVADLEYVTVSTWGEFAPLAVTLQEVAGVFPMGWFDRVVSPDATEPCTMGMGCDEAGVCYAAAQGEPERCPKYPDATEQVASILQRRFGRCETSYSELTEPQRKRWQEAARAVVAALPSNTTTNASLVEALENGRNALQRMMDTWLDYHDSHSLTQPVTCASSNAFDDALEARDAIDSLLATLRASNPESAKS